MMKIGIIKEHSLLFVLSMILLVGAGLAMATGSNDPTLHGHDIGEIDWSKTIPTLITNRVCLSGSCHNNWPTFTDTRCDTAGGCGQLCLPTGCRASWPSLIPEPPVCGGEQMPRWTGGAWTCALVDVSGPLYYQCPNLARSCVTAYPCKGQRSAIPTCNTERNNGLNFCMYCGCYTTRTVYCDPVYT